MRLWPPRSLFSQTGLVLAFSFLLYLVLVVGIIFRLIMHPIAEHAMEDLASLILLSTQIWAELPPDTRLDYERELEQRHHLLLRVVEEDDEHSLKQSGGPYVGTIQRSLAEQLGQPVSAGVLSDGARWYWFEIPMAGRMFRVGVAGLRLADQTPLAAFIILALGASFILLTSTLLVRRLIKPLTDLVGSVREIGAGRFPAPLAVSGPEEIAALARGLNRMVIQLQHLTENRTVLLAGISHDIRTPLTHMGLAVEMLPDDVDPDLLLQLRRDLDAMDTLIGQVMELSRGLQRQDLRRLDVAVLLQRLRQEYAHAPVEIRVAAPAHCQVELSETALRRVLTNLLDNAVRYGKGLPVDLICRKEQNTVYINVSDHGPGIMQSERDKIFQPFYRIEDSRNRQTGGSGLGLTVVRQLADANGWLISVQARPGGGACFTVEIPLSR